jgi:hypothetical protein
MLLDLAGDERHDVTAQYERRTILAESCLGVIALDECFVGPGGSIRPRRTRTGKEDFTAPPCSRRHGIRMLAGQIRPLS